MIGLMTLEEKLGMIRASSSFTSGGIPRLGIPELVLSDGPHGLRHEHGRGWFALPDADDKATYLPVGINLASTWNKDLGYEYGVVLGNEAKERRRNVLLGPGVNIIRSPLNGRNFEYLWGSVNDTREALLYCTDLEMGTELLKSFHNPDYDDFYFAP